MTSALVWPTRRDTWVHDITQADYVRRNLLLFRLCAAAEVGSKVFFVESAYIRASELRFKLGPRRDTVAAGTPPAPSFASQHCRYCAQGSVHKGRPHYAEEG